MSVDPSRQTATILPFKPRTALKGSSDARFHAGLQPATPRPAPVVGSSWYHEEAIRDADPTRKN